MNHKNGWSEDRLSPKREEIPATQDQQQQPRRVIISSSTSKDVVSSSHLSSGTLTNSISNSGFQSHDEDVLIVASKLKQYIKDKYGMSTSAGVMDILSHQVRRLTDRAAEKARLEGRKTVLDRDF